MGKKKINQRQKEERDGEKEESMRRVKAGGEGTQIQEEVRKKGGEGTQIQEEVRKKRGEGSREMIWTIVALANQISF